MATVKPAKTAHQHFALSAGDDVQFERPITNLIVTVAASTTLSFDGGANFMSVATGTHQFRGVYLKEIHLGTGSCTGVGISF